MSLSGRFPTSSACLFGCGLHSTRARPSDFSGGQTPCVDVAIVLAPVVQACILIVCAGSLCGLLGALVGWLMGLFSTYVYEKDVYMHMHQVRAQIA